ncbi:hypothetical protein [Halobacillus naozhouensis]|uniref:Uncharacterized protein n=1 Tax=Halobacillus naozhouensis TaxID=554880 RepID=A0ABY8J011_9BACI|nr:hypothetical protein [Halobacillus naozhouensis]WFT75828.1 hypothetical protein P9989_05445 [Halobacillus naozhouensis]
MRRIINYFIIGMILVITTVIYINHTYFFNPLSFSQDKITPHEWSDYQRPLTIKLYRFGEEREIFTIKKEVKIREILKALKKSPVMNQENSGSRTPVGGLTLSTGDTKLLDILFYKDHWEILKRDSTAFQMTNSMEQILQSY